MNVASAVVIYRELYSGLPAIELLDMSLNLLGVAWNFFTKFLVEQFRLPQIDSLDFRKLGIVIKLIGDTYWAKLRRKKEVRMLCFKLSNHLADLFSLLS